MTTNISWSLLKDTFGNTEYTYSLLIYDALLTALVDKALFLIVASIGLVAVLKTSKKHTQESDISKASWWSNILSQLCYGQKAHQSLPSHRSRRLVGRRWSLKPHSRQLVTTFDYILAIFKLAPFSRIHRSKNTTASLESYLPDQIQKSAPIDDINMEQKVCSKVSSRLHTLLNMIPSICLHSYADCLNIITLAFSRIFKFTHRRLFQRRQSNTRRKSNSMIRRISSSGSIRTTITSSVPAKMVKSSHNTTITDQKSLYSEKLYKNESVPDSSHSLPISNQLCVTQQQDIRPTFTHIHPLVRFIYIVDTIAEFGLLGVSACLVGVFLMASFFIDCVVGLWSNHKGKSPAEMAEQEQLYQQARQYELLWREQRILASLNAQRTELEKLVDLVELDKLADLIRLETLTKRKKPISFQNMLRNYAVISKSDRHSR
ncbi:hypothetical protein BDV3_005475 [Batrachochytrium dendrobatidis]